MSNERQLRLFDPPRPLLERFGTDFFKRIPKGPGVYLMYDALGKLIYVGQSTNLRQRLKSYVYTCPERSSRKLIRLVHAVTEIRVQTCADAQAARFRENQLLREHRPKFNRANTYPQAYLFFALQNSSELLRLALTRELLPEAQHYGAFKGTARMAYGALLRMLDRLTRGTKSWMSFPAQICGERLPRRMEFRLDHLGTFKGVLTASVSKFLAGESTQLLDLFQSKSEPRLDGHLFDENLFASDQDILADFFERGALRNLTLRRAHQISETWIAKEKLDDLLVPSMVRDRRKTAEHAPEPGAVQ